MNVQPNQDEVAAAVKAAIKDQIASIRSIAYDLDENEARVAYALVLLQVTRPLAILNAQVEELTSLVKAANEKPTILKP